jgi:hypothetical protein
MRFDRKGTYTPSAQVRNIACKGKANSDWVSKKGKIYKPRGGLAMVFVKRCPEG